MLQRAARRVTGRAGATAPTGLTALAVEQDGPQLRLRFRLDGDAVADALWGRDTLSDTWFRLADVAPPVAGEQAVDLDLRTVPAPALTDEGALLALAVAVTESYATGDPRVAELRGLPLTTVTAD